MSFPTITFKFNGLEEAKSLAPLVEQKFLSLKRFIGDSTNAQCEVEFEKLTAHQTGLIYRVEANFTLGSEMFRAEATELSFEAAIDVVRNELDKELSRTKDKHVTLTKRAGRKLKALFMRG